MTAPADETVPERALLHDLLTQRPSFHGFLVKRLHDPVLADDLLQDAYGRALSQLDTLRDRSASTAWFYALLRNAVADHHRRLRTRERALAGLARELGDATEPGPSAAPRACRCVARLARALDPPYAQALERIEIDGLSVRALAEEAAITPNNAAVRVFRARAALRRDVRATCGACAATGCHDCDCEHSA